MCSYLEITKLVCGVLGLRGSASVQKFITYKFLCFFYICKNFYLFCKSLLRFPKSSNQNTEHIEIFQKNPLRKTDTISVALQLYHHVLLTIDVPVITMLYIRSPQQIHFIAASLYPFISISTFSLSSRL